MLIQYFGGAGVELLIELALGLGSPKPRAVGLGLSAGFFACDTLLEPLEINYFPHARFPVRRKIGERRQSREVRVVSKASIRMEDTAMANSFIVKSSRKSLPNTNKKYVPHCKEFRCFQRD
jgi:hypothetical protein